MASLNETSVLLNKQTFKLPSAVILNLLHDEQNGLLMLAMNPTLLSPFPYHTLVSCGSVIGSRERSCDVWPIVSSMADMGTYLRELG